MSRYYNKRYPGVFTSFPSITAEVKLEYELLREGEE